MKSWNLGWFSVKYGGGIQVFNSFSMSHFFCFNVNAVVFPITGCKLFYLLEGGLFHLESTWIVWSCSRLYVSWHGNCLLVHENNLAMMTFLWRIYRFFCAIEPDMRLAWARRIHDILKPGGELITLMFPVIILICSFLLPFLFSFCNC